MTIVTVIPKRKLVLEKTISEFKESDSKEITLQPIRDDLESRVEQIKRGWKKLTAAEQKRTLRRLFKQLLIGPNGIDIYYYSNVIDGEITSGGLSNEPQNPAKVIPFRVSGSFIEGSASGSKSSIQNCLSDSMVAPPRLERGSTV